MKKQTWQQWARAIERDPGGTPSLILHGTLAALTGQDTCALNAIVACWELYACSDEDGQRGALAAVRAVERVERALAPGREADRARQHDLLRHDRSDLYELLEAVDQHVEPAVAAGLGITLLPRCEVPKDLEPWDDAPLPKPLDIYCGIYLREGVDCDLLADLADAIADTLRPKPNVIAHPRHAAAGGANSPHEAGRTREANPHDSFFP